MKSKNNLEREIKFHSEDLEALRERLAELEAERVGPPAFEDNWILDRGDELLSKGKILRLRSDGARSHLTFKGPMHMEGKIKVRPELEIGIEDAEQGRQLFEQLGYTVVRRYQKVREEWQLGGVTIALDHTPIGDFAEFEGDGAETVARRCGFDPGKGEARSYLRLYDDYLKDHPDAPPEMTFRQ
jgi:predicted adenylyl cyclase CyaB